MYRQKAEIQLYIIIFLFRKSKIQQELILATWQ